jgi:hypothetical protein
VRHDTSRAAAVTLAALALLALLPGRPLQADGGTLRVANVVMGAYRVNVYTDPTPIPPDTIDVSVLATFERGRGVAIGLEIEIVARRVGGPGDAIRHPATREQADDPRFYAAKFKLGSVGRWEITTVVTGPEGAGEVSFEVDVQEPGPLANPFLILALALIPLGLVAWWLRGDESPAPEVSSPSNRPEG